MLENLILRRASESDAATIAALLREAYEEYRGVLEPPSTAHAESEELVLEKMSRAEALLAEADGKIIACVFWETHEDHLYLFRLGVLPQFRRLGLGRILIQHVEQQARSLGKAIVELSVRNILTDNIAYYERLGYAYAREGDKTHLGKPFFCVMAKEIPPAP